MKVTNTHLRIAVLALGGLLILYAVLKFAFKIDFGSMFEQNFPTVVMVAAAAIFVWNRQIWNQEKKEQEAEEARLAEESRLAEEAQAPANAVSETTEKPKEL